MYLGSHVRRSYGCNLMQRTGIGLRIYDKRLVAPTQLKTMMQESGTAARVFQFDKYRK